MFPELELREGWITVVCLMLILLCVAWAIQAAHWTEGLAILQGVVLVGGLMGIMLAKSRTPNRMAHLLSLLTGLTWSIYLTSRVLADVLNVPIEQAVLALDQRIQDFLYIAFTGGTNADNHIFLLLLCILLWILAYFCAWAVFRWQRVWWAIIVSGLALMLNISYSSANLTIYLIGFLLFSLILVVRTSLTFYEQEWRQAGVSYSPELIHTFLRAGLIISTLAIFLSWVAPEALASRPLQRAWNRVGEPWRRFQDRSSRIFEDLNYQNEPQLIFSDRWMKFGGAVELTDTPILDVQAATGRYWRVIVFHEYTGEGWNNTDTDTILIDENEQDLAFPELELRREISQTFTLKGDLGSAGTLVAAGQPLRAGLPIRAVVSYITHEEDLPRFVDDSTFPPVPGDPSMLYSRKLLEAGDSYQVLSSLSIADEESLRQAKTDYPDWVTPRYVQLPESLPERVRLLAEQITADQENLYDKAKAIEDYLREIPYNDKINAPPPGQDGVDYFLFDIREGYCDYYSSAMVVMLRVVGIPARYVRGYSQGVRQEGVYHILEWDGHAWPEVYFPGYGWVEFEPTGGEPVIVRPRPPGSEEEGQGGPGDRAGRGQDLEDLMELEMRLADSGEPYEPPPQPLWRRIGLWGGIGLSLVALSALAIVLLAAHRHRQIEGLSVGERVYEDLVSWVRRLFRIEPLAHQTPHEYTGFVTRSVPQGRQAIEQIADYYVKERFGNKAVSDAEADVAWGQAWSALWHRWVERRVDRVRHIWWRLFPPKQPPQPPT